MSLDRSLKSASSLVRHRNVLTREERLARLKDEEKWTNTKSVFGLPKVGNRKAAVAAKAEKTDAAEGTPAAAGAAPGKGGVAAKGAAPAKAAAPAAPAAKGAKGAGGAKPAAAAPAKKK